MNSKNFKRMKGRILSYSLLKRENHAYVRANTDDDNTVAYEEELEHAIEKELLDLMEEIDDQVPLARL